MREADATELLRMLQRAVASEPLPAADSLRRKVVRLPRGTCTRQYVASHTQGQDANGAVEVYFQIGQETGGDEWRLLGLLAQIVEQPFYSELRTRQQLGYAVESGVSDSGEGVRGLVFSLQSSVLPPPQLEQRVDEFLLDFRASLVSMPDAEFAKFVEARALRVADADKTLALQAIRFWSEICARRFDFERPWYESAAVRRLTKLQLVDFFDARVAAGGSLRRRLSIHVFPRGAGPRKLVHDSLVDTGAAAAAYFPPPVFRSTREETSSPVTMEPMGMGV